MDNIFRSLPDFKGKRRLGRVLFKKAIDELTDIEIKGKWGCTYLLPHLKETVAWEIFVNGVYEEATIDFLDRQMPRGGVLVDAGSNIGAISIPLCKRRPDIRVIAIEAAPWVYAYLEKNISNNQLTNITPIRAALSDKPGIELNFYSPVDKFGKGSFSNNFNTQAIRITTTTLDDIVLQQKLSRVDIIKMDVEGYEAKVLRGGSELIRDLKPAVLFEFADWAENTAKDSKAGDAQLFLKMEGYQLFDFEDALKPIEGILFNKSTLVWAKKQGSIVHH